MEISGGRRKNRDTGKEKSRGRREEKQAARIVAAFIRQTRQEWVEGEDTHSKYGRSVHDRWYWRFLLHQILEATRIKVEEEHGSIITDLDAKIEEHILAEARSSTDTVTEGSDRRAEESQRAYNSN